MPAKALRSLNEISPQRSVWGEMDSGHDEELAPNIDLSRGSESWGSGSLVGGSSLVSLGCPFQLRGTCTYWQREL